MTTVDGYYNGSSYIALGRVDVKPNQKVRIVVLDEYLETSSSSKRNFEDKLSDLYGCGAGVWAEDAQVYVNKLRDDRGF